MKICSKCKSKKKNNQFHKRANYCKLCKKTYNASTYSPTRRSDDHEKNKQRNIAGNKQYYLDHKPERKDYYNKNSDRFKEYASKAYYSSDGYGIAPLFIRCRQRAKTYGILFDLDKDFLLQLYISQRGRCSITDIPFEFPKVEQFGMRPFAPSVDRIDSKLGYTKDNVRFVCAVVNLSLNQFGIDIFDKMCAAYIENRKL